LGQKESFFISKGLAEEGVILSLACIAVAKHDHRAGIFAADLVQDASEVKHLFPDRDRIVPADLKTFFTCFKASPTGRRTPACSSGPATTGATAAGSTAGRRRCRGSASASLRDSPGRRAHKGESHREGSKLKKVFPHRGNPF
jgi:hypothetical protein